MLDERTDIPSDEQLDDYEAAIEPLVAAAAPEVGPDRAFLGNLCDLLPSRTRSAQRLSADDLSWLEALRQVAHRFGLDEELVTRADEGSDSLWLVPRH
jgi:hypothetical protein